MTISETQAARLTANDIQPRKRGLDAVRAILSPESPNGMPPTLMTDLDFTIIEGKELAWTDGRTRPVRPETVASLMALREEGIRVGVITEQPIEQLQPTLDDMARLVDGKNATTSDLFRGPKLAEGGGVGEQLGIGNNPNEAVLLTSPETQEELRRIREWLGMNIAIASGDIWGVLSDVNPSIGTFVRFPSHTYQSSITLWEKGPHVMQDTTYIARYAHVQTRIQQAMDELGLTNLQAYEGGNGALRITARDVDKGQTILRLARQGVFDHNIVGAFDGPNDIQAAQAIRTMGGSVIAPSNAIPEIHALADYSANAEVGLGFAEVIAKVFPRSFERSIANLQSRGLWLTA